jgi:hypothetical protein
LDADFFFENRSEKIGTDGVIKDGWKILRELSELTFPNKPYLMAILIEWLYSYKQI